MQPIGRIRTTKPALGQSTWVILEGGNPQDTRASVAILNANDRDAGVQVTVFFDDRGPVGPHHLVVPARRVARTRLADLVEAGSVPPALDDAAYALVVFSDLPIVVQQLSFADYELAAGAVTFPIKEQ